MLLSARLLNVFILFRFKFFKHRIIFHVVSKYVGQLNIEDMSNSKCQFKRWEVLSILNGHYSLSGNPGFI